MDFFSTDSELDNSINSESTIDGTSGNDNLTGGTGTSTLTGQDGDDTLIGGTGTSTIAGGTGNDSLTGGSGSNSLTGGIGNDTLRGGTGGNNFDGGEGDDYLVGGTGSNSLTGGSGADTFFFSKVEYGSNSANNNVNITGEGTAIIDGEVFTSETTNNDETNREPINTIADFNTSEGDNIQLDATSFGIAPGDTSTLSFDNNTGILSVAEEPTVKVINGVDANVLANTTIVEGGGSNSSVVSDDGADSTDGTLNVYRFFETEKGFHFYTSSEQERDSIQQQSANGLLSYTYEGESFAGLAEDDDGDPLTGAKPVYRFFNNLTGAHLYTISEIEKDNIVNNLPDYSLEGVAYYAYDEPQENTIPLYRLYDSNTGTHFFTPSATEKDNTLDTLSQYSAEGNDGTAFYVLPLE